MPSNNVFQYSKIRTRKRSAKKSIKTGKKNGIQLFLESGIHCAGIRNPVPGIRNPPHGIQNPRLPRIPLHGASPSSRFIAAIHCDRCVSFEGKLKNDKSFPLSLRLSLVQQFTEQWSFAIFVYGISTQSPCIYNPSSAGMPVQPRFGAARNPRWRKVISEYRHSNPLFRELGQLKFCDLIHLIDNPLYIFDFY